MMSKKTLKEYDCESLGDWFDIIAISRINGQNKQAKEQYLRMSEKQKNKCLGYWEITGQTEVLNFIKESFI